MAKLGYTWYPKDWGNSESVFELSLSERGLYRELIDLAMMNDNKTEIKLDTWSRKFSVSVDELKSLLGKLSILNLIEIKGEKLFIPSCESRLKMVRGGSKGGKNKPTIKGNVKPIVKPLSSLEEKNDKPIVNQREIETKTEKENKNNIIFNELIISESWLQLTAMQSTNKISTDQVKILLKKYNDKINASFDIKQNKTEYCTHFINWLNTQQKENNKSNQNGWISPA